MKRLDIFKGDCRLIVSLMLGLVLASCSMFVSENKLDEVSSGEKIYIVQRERESLQVINQSQITKVEDLGNLNHATMKFKWGKGYLLARNGYISKVDIENDQLLKKVKVGKSGIGLTFTDEHVVIVNYEPSSVVVLSKDLDVVKTILTESRNVGVKVFKDLLVFSLMDKNEIWILDIKKDYEIVKKIQNIGNLPFDALINKDKYLVGFFNEPTIGFLDLHDYQYTRISLNLENSNVVYKVPHFGYWGIVDNFAFVPIAAQKKILVIDLVKKSYVDEINLPGEPVFAAVSPDKGTLVVNFSGDKENYLTIVDTKKRALLKTFEAGRRIMHLRFSSSGERLFVTSYFENKMHVFNAFSWVKEKSFDVATPSGVFLNTIVE